MPLQRQNDIARAACDAVWAGVPDDQREALRNGTHPDDYIMLVPVLVGALKRVRKASSSPHIAILTTDEDLFWSAAFEQYMNDYDEDETRADLQAWVDCQQQFPRLQQYDGCAATAAEETI